MAISAHIFGCHTQRCIWLGRGQCTGIQCVKPRDAAQHPATHRMVPGQNDLTKAVTSV